MRGRWWRPGVGRLSPWPQVTHDAAIAAAMPTIGAPGWKGLHAPRQMVMDGDLIGGLTGQQRGAVPSYRTVRTLLCECPCMVNVIVASDSSSMLIT